MGTLIYLGKKKDPEMIDWQELRVNIKISDMLKKKKDEHKHDKEMEEFSLQGEVTSKAEKHNYLKLNTFPLIAQLVKNLPAMHVTLVRFLG